MKGLLGELWTKSTRVMKVKMWDVELFDVRKMESITHQCNTDKNVCTELLGVIILYE